MFSEQISCSLLLELPDKGMESRFWESEGTVRCGLTTCHFATKSGTRTCW
jgi:hypothetical protein